MIESIRTPYSGDSGYIYFTITTITLMSKQDPVIHIQITIYNFNYMNEYF